MIHHLSRIFAQFRLILYCKFPTQLNRQHHRPTQLFIRMIYILTVDQQKHPLAHRIPWPQSYNIHYYKRIAAQSVHSVREYTFWSMFFFSLAPCVECWFISNAREVQKLDTTVSRAISTNFDFVSKENVGNFIVLDRFWLTRFETHLRINQVAINRFNHSFLFVTRQFAPNL